MQQGGPQFMPTGANGFMPAGQHQAFQGSPDQMAQFGAYGTQSPFGAPSGMQFGAPGAQQVAQPGAQQFAQPGAQQFAQPAAQVAPVACPAYVPPSGMQQQQSGAGQNIQQAYSRQMVAIARSLEQMIPGYQVLTSVLQEVLNSPGGQTLTGARALTDTLREAVYQHFATLGAIRRFLCGETSQQVLSALAAGINQLATIHAQARPMVERLVMGAAPELRATLSSFGQTVTAPDSLLNQASGVVRSTVGAQIWDAVVSRAAASAGVGIGGVSVGGIGAGGVSTGEGASQQQAGTASGQTGAETASESDAESQ